MTILDKIVASKENEVTHRKNEVSIAELENYPGFERKCNSLVAGLLNPGSTGIIAEFKQRSPSLGEINSDVKPGEVTRDYVNGGAAGISVLTDCEYFGGNLSDLLAARRYNPQIPLLRKDFMIDTYQIKEAKAYGADVILLIAACLEKKQAEIMAAEAKNLGMEVLMEVHEAEELEKLNRFVDIVGVNNRNLKTMEVNIHTSVKLAGFIPDKFVKISESGLSNPAKISYLKEYGYKGFLIGETFMKTDNPGEACRKFISEIESFKQTF